MFKVTLNLKGKAIKLYSFQYLGMCDFFEKKKATALLQDKEMIYCIRPN